MWFVVISAQYKLCQWWARVNVMLLQSQFVILTNYEKKKKIVPKISPYSKLGLNLMEENAYHY